VDLLAATSGGSEQKAESVVKGFSSVWDGRVLDIGCRSRELQVALRDHLIACYIGVDIGGSADVIADLGSGLPFADNSVDVVVALDVLEHIERIHDSFGELCRVATQHIVISLPNEFDIKHRLLTLRGRHTGKWGLPLEPVLDRHRWVFTLREARAFCRHLGHSLGWRVRRECFLVGPRRNNLIGRTLLRCWPSVFAPTYVVLMAPERASIA
jgi:hypothetical protein